MQLKVYDTVSNIERTVTKKAFDIINKGKRQRYQLLETLDDDGNPINVPAPAPTEAPEKKNPESQAVEAAAAEPESTVTATLNGEPIPVQVEKPTEEAPQKPVQKKRGPKPKVKNA